MVSKQEINNLLRENPPRVNLLRFLQNQHWVKERRKDGRFPNCSGTVLFILSEDFSALPKYVPPEFLAKFIEESGWVESRRNGSILWLRADKRENDHFAIYLGQINGRDIIFHQPNYGDGITFGICDLSEDRKWGYEVKFYSAPDFIKNYNKV